MKIVPGDSTHRYQRHEHWHRLKQTTGTQKRWPNSPPRYFKSMAISSSLLSLTLSFSTSRSHQFSLIQAASPTKNLWRGSRPWGARAARRCRGGACELAAAAAAEGREGRSPAPWGARAGRRRQCCGSAGLAGSRPWGTGTRSGAWRPVRGAGPEGEPDAPQLPLLRLCLAAAGAGPPLPAAALQIHWCLR